MIELVSDDECCEVDVIDREVIALKPKWVYVLSFDNSLDTDEDKLDNKINKCKKFPTNTQKIERILEERYKKNGLLEKVLGSD